MHKICFCRKNDTETTITGRTTKLETSKTDYIKENVCNQVKNYIELFGTAACNGCADVKCIINTPLYEPLKN